MLLFVYGTLKRDQRNHHLLADQRFVGPAATVAGYRLCDLGSHPGMVPHPHGGPVRGEVFDVSESCTDELDEFEEVPTLFDRKQVELTNGTTAWAYLYARPVPAGTPSGDEWPFG